MNTSRTSAPFIPHGISLNDVMTCVNAADYYQAVEIVRAARATTPRNVYLIAAERQAERLFELNQRGLLQTELRHEIIELLRALLERAHLQTPFQIERASPDQGSVEKESPASSERAAALQKLKKQYMQYAREFETKGDVEHAMAELRRIFIIDPHDPVARAYEQRLKHIQKVSNQTLAAADSELHESPAPYVDSPPLRRTDRPAYSGPNTGVPGHRDTAPPKGNGRPAPPTPIPGLLQVDPIGAASLPVVPGKTKKPDTVSQPPEASTSAGLTNTAGAVLSSQPLPVLESIEIKHEEQSAQVLESPSVPPAPGESGKDTFPTGLPEEQLTQVTGNESAEEGGKKVNGKLAAIAAASLAIVFAALAFYLTRNSEPTVSVHDTIPPAVAKAPPAEDVQPTAPAPPEQKPVANLPKKPAEKSSSKDDKGATVFVGQVPAKDGSGPASSPALAPSQPSVRVAETVQPVPLSAVTPRKVDVQPSPSELKDVVAAKPEVKTSPTASVELVREAQLTKLASPMYPNIALLNSLQGKVIVRVQLDRDGKPTKTEILKSTNQVFDDAAIEAAMNSSYSPRITSIGPVNSWVTIPFNFRP